jgi:hypothetical protein
MKLTLHLNVAAATKIIHGLAAAALVAALVRLGITLYSDFYLPYNLDDAPITPDTQVRDDPSAKLILETAKLLNERRATATAAAAPDVFWPPTSTAPAAKPR